MRKLFGTIEKRAPGALNAGSVMMQFKSFYWFSHHGTIETGRPRIQRQEWLCFSNRKAERTWSHSFLLADFAGTTCCSQLGVSESTIFMEVPNTSNESFLLHYAMMEPKMLPLKLSCMDLPRIRVRLLLFTENAVVRSRTGM